MNYLAICLEFSITYRGGTERNGTKIFISPFLIYFRPILAWNEFITVFFNFFVIFLEFSFVPWVRMERKDNSYFLCFAAFSCLSSLEMKPQWYFLIFLIFLAIYLEFSITHRVGTERNGTIIFASLFLIFFQPILAWNEFIMVFFNFLNYLPFLWNFLSWLG